MLMLFIVGIVIFVGSYFVFGGKSSAQPTQNQEADVAIREAVTALRQGMSPVREQVSTAVTDARSSYTQAARKARVNKLLADPEMLAEALAAQARPTPPPPPVVVATPPPPPTV